MVSNSILDPCHPHCLVVHKKNMWAKPLYSRLNSSHTSLQILTKQPPDSDMPPAPPIDPLHSRHHYYSILEFSVKIHFYTLNSNTQFQLPVKAVQTDWGGEYHAFTVFLNQFGIQHCLICPHAIVINSG